MEIFATQLELGTGSGARDSTGGCVSTLLLFPPGITEFWPMIFLDMPAMEAYSHFHFWLGIFISGGIPPPPPLSSRRASAFSECVF
jgi:hypothetical protein